jgi:transcriptional regulator with XRE-family HTH domain
VAETTKRRGRGRWPRAELAEARARADEAERLTLLHPRRASAADLAAMRKLARLGPARAARRLGVTPAELAGIEAGNVRPGAELAARMSRVYHCGEGPRKGAMYGRKN